MTTMNASTHHAPSDNAKNPTSEPRAAERFGDQAKKTAQDVQELGGMAKTTVQEKLGNAQAAAAEYLEYGQEKAEQVERSIEESIRANPIKFLLIAAGVGLVFGRFCMGR